MVKTTHKTGPWNLTDLKDIKPNGYKVMSCFHCGGGSTMGYKLSGYEVLGGVEIDPEMMAIYKANHNPKYSFLMGVQDFNKLPDSEIPKEFFDLDILDGSPPCSSFSMAGSREKAWGKNKKFREGQATQVLDDLFFHFIETARRLQPKVVIAENVKGLVMGKAKGYVKEINQMFNHAGYEGQLFLLNAAFMGVPQKRERTFFIYKKKSLNLPKLKLDFNEKLIPCSNIKNDISGSKIISEKAKKIWEWCDKQNEKCGGKAHTALYGKRAMFNTVKVSKNEPCSTITANCNLLHWDEPRSLGTNEIIHVGSFPTDFKAKNIPYVCGMSVPPYMMNRVSKQVELQWLNKL